MIALLCFFLTLFASPFKSKSRLEAENAALRHQLIVVQRKMRGRVHLTNGDRLFLVQLYRWFPSVLKTITIIRPETLVRWDRRASMASCSSSVSRSLSRVSRSIWSSDVDRRPRDGAPSCVTTRQTSPPWTYSLFRPLALICSTAWSSSGWRAEILSGSMSHLIQPRNGLHARSRRHSLGLRLRAT